jgi:chromosomal replication initiator protein
MDKQAEAIWRRAKESIRSSLSSATYEIWFDKTDSAGMEENTFLLAAPNAFTKDTIETRYLPLIESSLEEVVGEQTDVRIVVSPRSKGEDEGTGVVRETLHPGAGASAGLAESRSAQTLNSGYTFERFVIGSSNRFAHAAALAVAEAPAAAYNPLFIYGGVGLGKTHLLQAIGHYVATNNPEMTVKYLTIEMFTNDFINSLRDKQRIEGFKRKYRENDILLIDDIQFLENKEQTQEEFFHTFNTLYEAGKQVAISSDRPPREIATLEERLRSRFESGLITDIQPPDLETRLAILGMKVSADNIAIEDQEVLNFIAESFPSNIRELEGALIRVVALASLTGSEITLSLAKEALKNLLPMSLDTRITIDQIQNEVCRSAGISMADLKGVKRSQNIVFPRQMAMYLCRELTDSSLSVIGEKFGGKDHTTVIHAITKISNLIKEEREVYNQVQEITGRLKSRGRRGG